jgi:hypothetical protein
MHTLRLVTLLVAGLVTTAAAQPVPLDVFLEQRVAEELAADGTILSRLGVALDVEVVGDKLIVSLVDPATRRALATTKIDKLPEDREAAVATITQIAANLTTQLQNSNATAAAVKNVLEQERKEREQKELAKAAFEREAIRFNDIPIVTGSKESTSTTITAIPYRGGRRLTPPQFFDAIERPDLRDTYNLRRNIGVGALAVGGAVVLGGLVVLLAKATPDCDVSGSHDDFAACMDENSRWAKIGFGIVFSGTAVMGGGWVALRVANPISDREAYDLADAYNAKLRVKHGLPTAQTAKRFHDVAVAPYASAGGGGLTLGGRF